VQEATEPQLLFGQFPTQTNRENIWAIREFIGDNREFQDDQKPSKNCYNRSGQMSIQLSALERITDSSQTSRHVRKVPCVDGSGLASAFFT